MAISTDPNRPNSMKFNELSPGVQQNSVRGGGGGGGGLKWRGFFKIKKKNFFKNKKKILNFLN